MMDDETGKCWEGESLKTLKEIPLCERDREIISSIAIKWVKDDVISDTWTAEEFITEFFNIAEEDLK